MKCNIGSVMKLVARFPDLNHSKNIWGILVRRVYTEARQFETVKELKKTSLLEWAKLDSSLCCNLARSRRNRCVEVIERGGQKTHY